MKPVNASSTDADLSAARQAALTVVRALTDAAITLGEMSVPDEGYMRDLDEAKVDAVLAVLGYHTGSAKLVREVLRSQKNAHKKSLLINKAHNVPVVDAAASEGGGE